MSFPPFHNLFQFSVEKLFPDFDRPDTENVLHGGVQYRAPDYSLMGGRLLIELKSINPTKKVHERLEAISERQGKKAMIYGTANAESVFRNLPNPDAARTKLTDEIRNKVHKCLNAAKDQFSRFVPHQPYASPVRLVGITDNSSDALVNTEIYEYEIGRLLGGDSKARTKLGLIDAVVFIRNPKFVLPNQASGWFLYLRHQNTKDNLCLDSTAHQLNILTGNHLPWTENQSRLAGYRILKIPD